MNLSVYQSIPSHDSVEAVSDYFLSTLLPTNRRWGFYVDWNKVGRLAEEFKVELGILGAVLKAGDAELTSTIRRYPEVVRVFPHLLAVRDSSMVILEDAERSIYTNYDFSRPPQNADEIKKCVIFWKKSGLADALQNVRNLHDYYFGVEVGSDTNARKNRGGTEWEGIIEPLIKSIAARHGYTVEVRQKFERIMDELGYHVERDLERNMDFLVYKGNKFVDIEANFFSGSGTKLEVPGAYVNRQAKGDYSLSFILFTDGPGWLTAKSRLHEYFTKFPCVTNYKMATQGVLETALQRLLG